jgi:hypothetical protein
MHESIRMPVNCASSKTAIEVRCAKQRTTAERGRADGTRTALGCRMGSVMRLAGGARADDAHPTTGRSAATFCWAGPTIQ